VKNKILKNGARGNNEKIQFVKFDDGKLCAALLSSPPPVLPRGNLKVAKERKK
jgi:hypothetical protein